MARLPARSAHSVILICVPVLLRTALLAVCVSLGFAQTPPLLDTLGRSWTGISACSRKRPILRLTTSRYQVTEQEVGRRFGHARRLQVQPNRTRGRVLDVTVRVGSPKLDNYHRVRGDRAQFTAGVTDPLEDSPAAIQRRCGSKPTASTASPPSASSGSDQPRSRSRRRTTPTISPPRSRPVFEKPPARLSFSTAEWTERLRRMVGRVRDNIPRF